MKKSIFWRVQHALRDQLSGDFENIGLDKLSRLFAEVEHLLNFGAQISIVTTNFIEKSCALAWLTLEGGREKFVNLSPTVGFHLPSLR